MLILFFFNDTATTEIYTLSLHDALPIYREAHLLAMLRLRHPRLPQHLLVHLRRAEHPLDLHHPAVHLGVRDRKSTRLNSSHANISYAVFCLQKKTPGYSTRPRIDDWSLL